MKNPNEYMKRKTRFLKIKLNTKKEKSKEFYH